jgi:hypothetical protein
MKNLHLGMFGRNAMKPVSKEVENMELQEINESINKGRNEMFKKYGVKVSVIECEYTNEQGNAFIVYYFKEVYAHIKHLKNIKYIRNVNVITTQIDRLNSWVECAKTQKRKLNIDLDLSTSKMIVL